MIFQIRAIKNVRSLGENPEGYVVDMQQYFGGEGWIDVTHVARPGGGGACDQVLAEISAGNYEGEITPWQPGG